MSEPVDNRPTAAWASLPDKVQHIDNRPTAAWASLPDKVQHIDNRRFETLRAALRCGEALEAQGFTVRWLYVVPAGICRGQWRCGKEEFKWALGDEVAADTQTELALDVTTSTREILRLVKVA